MLLLYGSYGYTGRLIAEECRRQNLQVVLSGRDAQQLATQSQRTGYPYQVCQLNDTDALRQLLSRVKAVIHCAGPFRYTAYTMAQACLEAGVHYTDITGEYEVFERLATLDEAASKQNIMIMPGTGFDVVPTDCLAVFLKNKLPDATHLQLAFAGLSGGLSRGTRKSMIENLGSPGKIRVNGKLTSLPLGERVMEIDFGKFRRLTMCIPWGDIATAWYSTTIPNIEVYAGVSPKTLALIKYTRFLNPLLRTRAVKNLLHLQADRQAGPSTERILQGKSYVWGKVWNAQGKTAEARIETLNGYLLTSKTSVLIARHLLNGNFKPGFQTPAMAYGPDLILQVEGTTRTDGAS